MANFKKAIVSVLIALTLFSTACNDSNPTETPDSAAESTTTTETTTTESITTTETTTAETSVETELSNSFVEYDKNSLISIVRNGSLFQYPDIPLKKAFSSFIGELEWDALSDETGNYVNASGYITIYDEESYVDIIYRIDPENGAFVFDSAYLDNVKTTDFFYKLLEYKIMDQYIYGGDTIENYLISFIKNGTLNDYEDIPLGLAIENWFGSPTWEAILADDDNYYVNVRGTVTQYGEEAEAVLQYLVDVDNETFSFSALEVDEVPQTVDVYSTAINDMMENIASYLN